MENLSVDCKNGSFNIEERALAFLRIYKGVETDEDLANVFSSSAYGFLTKTFLNYRNINLFLNFLSNPNSVSIMDLKICNVDEMIEMIESFVDVSCEYALNDGNLDRVLYRYEDKRNINGYTDGSFSSIKSASCKPRTIKYTFGSDFTVPLAYQVYGFCPYIKIDDVLGTSLFSNEEEYIFPPFIGCELTDDYVNDYQDTDSFRIISVKDDYLGVDSAKLEESFHIFNSCKKDFQEVFRRDRKNGFVSDELLELSKNVHDYLRNYARNKYHIYSLYHQSKYSDNSDEVSSLWGDEYKGIEDAMVQYFCNSNPEKSWASNDTLHVYVFEKLVDNGFIPVDILPELYISGNSKVLDDFFKNRNDDSGYRSLSDDEYQEFINNFNLAAGYGNNHYPEIVAKRMEAANNIIYADYIEQRFSAIK